MRLVGIMAFGLMASACSSDPSVNANAKADPQAVPNEVPSLEVSRKHISQNLDLIRKQSVFDFTKVAKSQENWEIYVDNHCNALDRNGDGMISLDDCRAKKAQARVNELAGFIID